MNNDVKVRYRKIEPKIMSNKGYINLDNMKIETKEDLAEISNIFRNPVYETFRMIYMKKNRIIGYESISSKEPNYVKVFPSVNKRDVAKCIYKIKNRMERLNADGYYMVHNHPSGNTKASLNGIKITKFFRNNIYKF